LTVISGIIGGIETVSSGIDRARTLVSADPATLNPIDRGIRGGLRAFCRGRATDFGNAAFTVAAGQSADYICEPLYDEPGNDPGNPSPDPPFTGGQCPVNYNGQYRITANEGNSPPSGFDSFINQLGPISTRWVTSSTARTLQVLRGNGTVAVSRSIPIAWTGFSFDLTVTRSDGQADDCGNPPAPPPIPPTVNQPYNWGDVEDVGGIPVRVLPPSVNIPINIDVGGIAVPITFGNAQPPQEDPSPPLERSPSVPSVDSNPQGGRYDFGEPPDGQEWCGFTYSLSDPTDSYSGIPNTGPFHIFPRVLGNGRLIMVAGNTSVEFPGENVRYYELGGTVIRQDPGLIVVGAYTQCTFPYVLSIFPLSVPIVPTPNDED